MAYYSGITLDINIVEDIIKNEKEVSSSLICTPNVKNLVKEKKTQDKKDDEIGRKDSNFHQKKSPRLISNKYYINSKSKNLEFPREIEKVDQIHENEINKMKLDPDSCSDFIQINKKNESNNNIHNNDKFTSEIIEIRKEIINEMNGNNTFKAMKMCLGCQSYKTRRRHNYCYKCTYLRNTKIADKCQCLKPHYGKGYCIDCYKIFYRKKKIKEKPGNVNKKSFSIHYYKKLLFKKPLKVGDKCDCKKPHYARGYCKNCYRKIFKKPNRKAAVKCECEKPHYARGFCKACYYKFCQNSKKFADKCNCNRPLHAKGYCKTCYEKVRRRKKPHICSCKRVHYAKGYCKNCYDKIYGSRRKIADKCGCNKLHHAKGYCKTCYDKVYWEFKKNIRNTQV